MPRVMEITTPLGADELLFHAMHAREELSRVSEFQIDLLSLKEDISPDALLGQTVSVQLLLPDDSPRFFSGYVTRFAQRGTFGRYHRYFAIVRPWPFFMTRTADCRIFQEMTAPDIIKMVCADHGMADVAWELTATYRPWVYCVQYRETDFNFVSRLMEHEGMYYYFRHAAGRATMVITDSSSKHAPAPGYAEIPFITPGRPVRPELEHIRNWGFAREVQAGAYVHDDYDFERPSVDLLTEKVVPRTFAPSAYEMYDYPGTYVQKGDGLAYAGIRIDECGTQIETAHAVTNARGVAVGCLFTMKDFIRGDQNREHLVTGATFDLEYSEYEGVPQTAPAEYRCTFEAMSTAQQFRPKRTTPKPFVQGPQTAVVVGPPGEEIFTDKYGRVKVQFHWDRYGQMDQRSSCWVRVSSPWAGKNWGAVSLPRIGQEVVVDFLEGDPDQPLITGRVYNAEQMPPYALPANKTQSGMKSRSSMGGGADNFNEIRFEDLKGSEQLFIHAEKNQDIEVEVDETHWVGHDRTKTIDNDETTHVKHDRTETVDNNETITIGVNRLERVGANETVIVGGNRAITVSQSEAATVALQRTHSVGANETITVGGAQEMTVGGLQAITVGAAQMVNVGANQSTSVGGNESHEVGDSRTTSIGKNESVSVGKNLVINAGDSVVIQTGSASISMRKDGSITIKGKDISIQGSGTVNVKASGDVVVKGSKVGVN